ncbi:MAG: hypothetical protein PHT66_00610 [Candidatus Pacebacteria bacterium]|nr:hypothetical protein [Candidatus Paceibacterota bacterium]
MSEDKHNDFLTLYNKLPESIQNFLASDEIGEIIDSALNLTKTPSEHVFFSIMNLVTEILSLQLSRKQFKNELQKRIKITTAEAQIIDQIIQTKIFDQFNKELDQYKEPLTVSKEKTEGQTFSQKPLSTKIPPLKPLIKNKTIKPLEKKETQGSFKKAAPVVQKTEKDIFPKDTSNKIEPEEQKQFIKEIEKKEESNEIAKEQIQNIPEYSFPEPSKIEIERPKRKAEEFKKVIAPKTTPSQQDKIRQKLLEAMTKKDIQPKIVNEMKNVLVSKQKNRKEEKKQEELPKKKLESEKNPSEVLSGEGKKFQDEEPSQKISNKKPYILDVKLKEMQKRKEEKEPISREPIRYQKYQEENPFGEA